MTVSLGQEPVAITAAGVSVLTVIQALAIPGISAGVHGIIVVVLVVLGAAFARSRVAPLAAVPTPPASGAVR